MEKEGADLLTYYNISKPERVICLFERSGTFKNVFKTKGFAAFDVDLEKTEHVDWCLDIFKEIDLFMKADKYNVFDTIKENDLVMAFFPCTFFSDQSQLNSRGDNYGQKEWDLQKKLEYSVKLMNNRAEYYKYLCQLIQIAIIKKFRLIIENPAGKAGFLKQYLPLKPAFVINDRTEYGDLYKKPTMFYFINCKPSFTLQSVYTKQKQNIKAIENIHGFERSKITKTFAENFIDMFVI